MGEDFVHRRLAFGIVHAEPFPGGFDVRRSSPVARRRRSGPRFCGLRAAPPIPPPPVARVTPVTDTYFGVSVTDPYRWMEDRTAPEFLAWAKGENDYARAVLAQIPGRDALLKRIAGHTAGRTSLTGVLYAGGRVFYEKREPGQDTPSSSTSATASRRSERPADRSGPCGTVSAITSPSTTTDPPSTDGAWSMRRRPAAPRRA